MINSRIRGAFVIINDQSQFVLLMLVLIALIRLLLTPSKTIYSKLQGS